MKRKIIAIDVDDVIADSLNSIRKRVNEHLSINLTEADYTIENEYWDYLESVWDKHGIKDKVDFSLHENEMVNDQSHMDLLPGAAFAISELSKRFDLAIVTARTLTWETATLKWLNEQFGEVFRAVHFVGNPFNGNPKPKGEQARELGAEWLIDDSPSHCQSALDAGLKAILFGEYGWHINIPKKVVRCKNWQEVLEYFDVA